MVEDARDLPGNLAFVATSLDGSVEVRVWKGTPLEDEIAQLL